MTQQCSNTGEGFVPIPDMGAAETYQSHLGRLYEVGGAGTNTIPAAHATDLATAAAAVVKLDAAGSPSPSGKIGVVCIGFSNVREKFAEFVRIATSRSPSVVLVNGAKAARAAAQWADSGNDAWSDLTTKVTDKGITDEQVQVVWLEMAIADASGDFATHLALLKGYMKDIVELLYIRFPNLQLIFWSPRTYGGYSTSGNPEPYAYESGFAVRDLIKDQYTGDDPDLAVGTVPAMAWATYDDGAWTGAYWWADGTTANSDGLLWNCADFEDDGLHPAGDDDGVSAPNGAEHKCAALLLAFFENSPYTSPWWTPALTPTLLSTAAINTAANNFDIPTYTPTPNTLQLIPFFSRAGVAATPESPSATGHSITWELIERRVFSSEASPRAQVGWFRGVSGSITTAGTVNVTFNSQNQSVFLADALEIAEISTAGTNGSAAIVQSTPNSSDSVNSLDITMDAETDEAFMLAVFGNILGANMTEKSGWTEINDIQPSGSPQGSMHVQWLDEYDSTATSTRSGAGTMNYGGLALGLRRPALPVLLELFLSGPGSVTSSPAGIDCPATACEFEFDSGAVVTLTAVPDYPGITVVWSGDYDSVSGFTATVTMDEAKSISVSFSVVTKTTVIERSPHYEVWLCTDLGQRIALLSPIAFDYVMGIDEVGAFSILMPGTFPRQLLEVDRQLQFWRRHRGRHSLELDQVGFLRRWRYETDGQGRTTLKLSGPDIQELLFRRIAAYAAGTANAGIATAVDNGMKDVFDTNFLASASDGDRNISANEVTVQQDLSDGGSVTKSFSWRNVLDVLQELNAASRTAGTEVFFRLVWQGIDELDRLQLQFRTYTGQPGRDLTYPHSSMVFGLEFGNLVEPSLEYDHTNEVNYVYAGGQGEGSDRTIVEVSDIARIAKSAWNRREGFRDARNESTSAGVTAAANAMLAEFRPRERFSGTIMDTKFTPYGSGWGLGDRLSATYTGRQFDEVLRKVAVRVTEDGEVIRGAFEGGRLITDPVIDEIVGNYARLRAMLSTLATAEDVKFKGSKASDFNTTDLPNDGQYGLQTAANEVQINFGGVIRAIPTSAL